MGRDELLLAFVLDPVSSGPSNLRTRVQNARGDEVRPPYWFDHGVPVTRNWLIPLGPGYFYGQEKHYTSDNRGFTDTPGRYRIVVTYEYSPTPEESARFVSSYERLGTHWEDFKLFSGKIESNPVWVTIAK